ncbi:FadR/GntR family transcriptional regulator [Saccharopolyspora mangrovi]|uniref:FadR/GntR family transcriptional regulator n=1 Tax=Saccharopolyspora mangrovi TaxID=3082379 RepID=A0ABU6AC91_9PSEU|nr:FadR/GntR family transcriptional regulator [Saccharopolyspora sp. S2-29]MEB3369159.1 FadR/GntR family transcriptional regulator [Saccharopolyspora sp. S2-29]
MSLPEELAEQLLGSVIDGTYPPGGALPSEPELAELFSMSRLTVREAIKALRVQNVVRIERGRGTYVNPPVEWTSLHPMVRAATSFGADPEVVAGIHEARQVLEAGVAELAALKRTEADLQRLHQHLREMRQADSPEARAGAHVAFHEAIVHATGNAFVPLLFEPFTRLLSGLPAETDRDAVARHERLLAAIEDGDPVAARRFMAAHLHFQHDQA